MDLAYSEVRLDFLIRIIKGPGEGTEHRIALGETIIGRSEKAHVKIAAPGVSWEHAVISRTGDDYFIENLSANGTFVNDTKITAKVKLRPRDQIRLDADTLLRFQSPTGSEGLLSSTRFLWTAAIIMVLIIIASIVFHPFRAAAEDKQDWPRTFVTLCDWVDQRVADHTLPAAASSVFRNGWRLDQISDYSDAKVEWLRMEMVLTQADNKLHAAELASEDTNKHDRDARHITYVERMLGGHGDNLAPEEVAAAAIQFVQRREKFAALKAPSSRIGL